MSSNEEYNCMIYVIKQGDTLYSISRKYNVPLALIIRVNPYVDIYNLQIGDELCLPFINSGTETI
jgi:LysM repeat protein